MTSSVRTFEPDDADAVRRIMEASLAVDAIPGFLANDIDRAMIRVVPDPGGTVVAIEDGAIVGYCTPNHDDLTVLPGARRRGHGRRLIAAASEVVGARGGDVLQLYVPPHLPASVAFAEAMGMVHRSSLWQFQLPMTAAEAVPAPAFPPEVVVRTWDDTRDVDYEAWSAFMLRAFEGHPTPMHWTPALIRHVHDAPGFDPGGVLLVADAAEPDALVAFCRAGGTRRAADRGRRAHRGAARVAPPRTRPRALALERPNAARSRRRAHRAVRRSRQ
jgi:mycothiol synthase